MLTERGIRALKPEGRDYVVSDKGGARGDGKLILRVRPTGTKEFYYQHHEGGKRKRRKLGNWPDLSLAEAREKAKRPPEVKADSGAATFDDLLESYIQKLRDEGATTAREVERCFAHDVREPFPGIVALPACQIEPTHITKILRRMIERGVTTTTNRVRSRLHAAFNHGLMQEHNPRVYVAQRFFLTSNPVAAVPIQGDWERAGERTLSADEVVTLWRLMPYKQDIVTAEFVRFLFATGGQRPRHVLKAPWTEYAADSFTIMDIKGKKGERRHHVVPLETTALSILDTVRPITGEGAYPFQGRRGGPLGEDAVTHSLTTLADENGIKRFTMRDIRRTCKTLMGEAGISKETRDRLQSHSLSDVSSKHYDRYDYLREKREAMQQWDRWLRKTLGLRAMR